MHARVVSNQIQPSQMDQWLAIVRDSAGPSLNEQDGFQGLVALTDLEHDNSIGYSMRTSAADLAVSETSGNYQQQIAKLADVPAAPPVRQVFQVTIVAQL